MVEKQFAQNKSAESNIYFTVPKDFEMPQESGMSWVQPIFRIEECSLWQGRSLDRRNQNKN